MAGVIINWINSIASIPSPWLLCDGNNGTPNLLDKYLLSVGASEEPGTTGGSTTHTHTSPAHGHTQDSHTHAGNTGETAQANSVQTGAYSGAQYNHIHAYTTNSAAATNQTTAVTIDTASNDPSYYKVAPIYDSSEGRQYPQGSLIFWPSATLPNGWTLCDGNNGTPDLRNKFLKCVGSGEAPGGTGGSSTHTHSPNSHTHTQNSHTHDGTSDGVAGGYMRSCGGSTYQLAGAHTHSISAAASTATNQSADVTLDTINGEPTFKKLLIIKNTGVLNRPKYGIVVWTGTIANIPLGYALCDGSNGTPDLRDYFVKGASDSSELENTGGSSQHNHTASSHNHTQNSHTHTISTGSSGTQVSGGGTASVTISSSHGHPDFTSGETTATNQATTITIDNCSSQANYPPYYKVAYIMQTRELDIGSYAFMVN